MDQQDKKNWDDMIIVVIEPRVVTREIIERGFRNFNKGIYIYASIEEAMRQSDVVAAAHAISISDSFNITELLKCYEVREAYTNSALLFQTKPHLQISDMRNPRVLTTTEGAIKYLEVACAPVRTIITRLSENFDFPLPEFARGEGRG